MNRSTKAALLSGLVFPGSGHLYLKQLKRGYTILILTIVCLSIVVVNTVNQALSIVAQLQKDGGTVDINRATELATQASQNTDQLLNQLAILLLLACWIFGIFDSYRLANKKNDIDAN